MGVHGFVGEGCGTSTLGHRTGSGESVFFWSDDPTYYTTSNWLGPGNNINNNNKTMHTVRALCFGNTIQGDHCVLFYPMIQKTNWNSRCVLKTLQNGMVASEHMLINFQCKSQTNPWRCWWACIVIFVDPMIQYIILPQIGLAQNKRTT